MTLSEKVAYIKGYAKGLGLEEESASGKLWTPLLELLTDMAHEIEDLQASNLDHAQALDDISEDLSYLEELTCDLDMPDLDLDEDCEGDCCSCGFDCGQDEDEEDEELSYDGVIYDVTCPSCGEEISFDEDTLALGSISCPNCGELLEFDLSGEEG